MIGVEFLFAVNRGAFGVSSGSKNFIANPHNIDNDRVECFFNDLSLDVCNHMDILL